MLKRRATPELYQNVLDDIKDNPSMPIDRIALAHGVEPSVVQSWYETGLETTDGYDVKQYPGDGAPLKVLLTLQSVRARAKIQQDDASPPESVKSRIVNGERKSPAVKITRSTKYKLKAAWDAAQEDAVESLALKGKTVRASRQNAAMLLSITGRLLNHAEPLLAKLQKDMLDPNFVNSQTPKEILSIYGKLSRMSKDVLEVAKFADELETALLGSADAFDEPNAIDVEASDEDALAVIESAAEAAAYAKEYGAIGGVLRYSGDDDEDQRS